MKQLENRKKNESKDDGEKSRKDKKSTVDFPVWSDVRIMEKITGKRESSKKQLK